MRRGHLRGIACGAVLAAMTHWTTYSPAQFEQTGQRTRPAVAPCPAPCPGPLPSMPSTRQTPRAAPEIPSPTPSDRPGERPSTEAQAPSPADSLSGETASAVGASSVAVSPNMFGDAFSGAGALRVVIPRQLIFVPGTPPQTRTFAGTFMSTINGVQVPTPFRAGMNAANQSTFETAFASSLNGVVFPAGSFVVANNTAFLSNTPVLMPPATTAPLLQNLVVSNAILANVVVPGEVLAFVSGTANAIIPGPTQIFSVNQAYNLTTPGTPGFFIPQQSVVFLVPSPGGGGAVGRTKISDDNNPLPRDRVIFNFDYFDNVPLTANGFDVRRYSPGFEKTFFNRNASIEIRFPFASTLSSDINAIGASGGRAEFGNVNITLKALLYGSDTFNVASGLGISLPTADDVRVGLGNGTQLLRIDNDAVILSPYIAALYTPGKRFFNQTWVTVGFDANGNPVSAATTMGGGLGRVGRVNDPSLLQIDSQFGYWIVSPACDTCRWIRGLAPFFELHYNTTISDPDAIALGAFQVTDSVGRYDELNVSAGLVAQIGDNLNLSIGAVAPLRGQADRFFDYQIGLRVNYFFGPTARARQQSSYVSGF